MKEILEAKLAKLTEDRDKFVLQANQQTAFMNGKIQLLKELLKELEESNEGRCACGDDCGPDCQCKAEPTE